MKSAVNGYEDAYEVYSDGRVFALPRSRTGRNNIFRRLKGRFLTGTKNNKGYVQFQLWSNNKSKRFLVHRLVADAFILNPQKHPLINHIDGNPMNNTVSNLEWCTYSENMKHAYKTGLRVHWRLLVKSKRV